MIGKLEVVAGEAELARRSAELFVELARDAIAQRGLFNVTLAGGSTPKAAFDLLCAEPLRSNVDWSAVFFYFGDERSVGPDDPNSNFGMAREHLLGPLGIASEHVYRIRGELTPQKAADEYEATLRRTLGERPIFDLVNLGMGPDGHTASLFPGTLAQIDPQRLVAVTHVEKLNTDRITVTSRVINSARAILVAAGGESKAASLAQVLSGPRNPDLYPSQLLNPENGTLTWLVDRAAARGLEA
ncbi:MAG: 6-phosphogluconolactonase [Candidatus Eremiobacteraeota bacterium]|nr:6-phosphogluconolactonase [Candidatus Eremiobacteraeota bacterium]